MKTKFVSMREVKKGDSSTLKQIILSIKTSNINKAFSAHYGIGENGI